MTLRKCFSLASCAFVLGFVIVAIHPTASAASWKEKVLYSLQGSPDAANPVSGVVFDQQGNLYGTARVGRTAVRVRFFSCPHQSRKAVPGRSR
jgi:hypothetical protein